MCASNIGFMFISHLHFILMDVESGSWHLHYCCSFLTTRRPNTLPLGCLKSLTLMAQLWLLNYNNFLINFLSLKQFWLMQMVKGLTYKHV
jgi:hypothetical protein